MVKKKKSGKPFPALFDENSFTEAEIDSLYKRAISTTRDLVAELSFNKQTNLFLILIKQKNKK